MRLFRAVGAFVVSTMLKPFSSSFLPSLAARPVTVVAFIMLISAFSDTAGSLLNLRAM